MGFFRRIGIFLVLLGLLLILLFVFSDIAHVPNLNYVCLGSLALLLGIFLQWTNPPPPREPTGRFRLLRKRREDRSQKRDK